MAIPPAYHADSDADDEYERSVMTSPLLHTDDDTSPTDSDPPSTEPTPTTFGHNIDPSRLSPGSTIVDWTTSQCADYISSLGLPQYCDKFLENEIIGEALIALRHEELKEMGIISIGHRLTILKGVYDVKIRQEIPIDSDHWFPPSADAETRDSTATKDDISRIIESIRIRDIRIQAAESELRKITEEYRKLRDELLPIFRMAKERQPLPYHPNSHSPDHPDDGTLVSSQLPMEPKSSGLSPANAASNLLTAQSMNGGSQPSNSPNQANIPSPTSPNTYANQPTLHQRTYRGDQQTPQTARQIYSHAEDPYSSSVSTFTSERDPRNPTPTPGAGSRYAQQQRPQQQDDPPPSGGSTRDAPSVEIFKSFRVSMEDPCEKVLPAALKKYNINADWKNYALYIVYGDQERCLGLREKPLILFKQLDKEGKKPMFMLRRHAAPMEGHSGPSGGGGMGGGVGYDPSMGLGSGRGHQSSIQLPGGVL